MARTLLVLCLVLAASTGCKKKKAADPAAGSGSTMASRSAPEPSMGSGSAPAGSGSAPAAGSGSETGSAAGSSAGSGSAAATGSGSSAAAGGKKAPKAEDADLIAALEGAKVEWQSGAGKSVLMVENLECKEDHQKKPTVYSCSEPKATDKAAEAIIKNLNTRGIKPVKEHGDVTTFKVASVRCRQLNEGDSGEPDACEVTP